MLSKHTPYTLSRVLLFVHLSPIFLSVCWTHFNWSVFTLDITEPKEKKQRILWTFPAYLICKIQYGHFYRPFSGVVKFSSFKASWEVQKLQSLARHNILQQHWNNLSYTLSIFPALMELLIHSPCLWLYWSFVIPIEWNWYFLTKCNLLEQTSSQVLMKRIQGNSHCELCGPALPRCCLLCMHFVMLTVLISTVPFN